MDELKGHEESVNVLCGEGEDLVQDGHFAASEIKTRLDKLHDAWNSLNKQAKQRTTRLNDSLQLQQVINTCTYTNSSLILFSFIVQFFMKSTETESWMKDKYPLVSSEDYGKDEDSTLALIKKHEAVQQELESCRSKVRELKESSENMIAANHYSKSDIKKKQV